MLEKLSPISLRCFDAAKQNARRLQSGELDTRHLMMGLIAQREAWLTDLLQPYNVTTSQINDALEKSLGKGTHAASDRLIVGAGLKSVLRQSIDLAHGTPVTPVHLLTAALQMDEALSGLLGEQGVKIDELRAQLDVAQTKPPTQETSTTPASEESTEAQTDASEAGATTPAAKAETKYKTTPTLDRYSRDLTKLAENGELHTIVGRDREIASMVEILCRTIKRNPMLVGEPGVGKTALAEGLAQRIVARQVPELLQDHRLVELSISSLVAGASVVGQFEERLQKLVNEVQAAENVILFVDEAHALMGAGGIYGRQDAATILKPALARGDIVCIGATTTQEYRKYLEKDGALARRFQPVRVEEPDRDTVLGIMSALKPRFEDHFRISIPVDLLDEIYDLSKVYLKNRYFPDKAIDLMERAASRTMLTKGSDASLTADGLLSVLSDMTGIPLEKLDQGEMERYLHMEETLAQRVKGQPQAIEAVASLVRLTKRRLDLDPTRPDGVFLFIGPSGVGKTELAKALTHFLFGDEDRLIRLDMSEFSEEFTVSRLIGSPPGYVGYDEGGQLTERVRSQPFCVIALDEIEKAHPAVRNLFLQVFDDGRLTDAQGRTVHFSDATIIMTSNLASDLWFHRRLGFEAKEEQLRVAEDAVAQVLRRKLPAEFISRIDEIVVFEPLDDNSIIEITRSKLTSIIQDRFTRQNIAVSFDDSIAEHIAHLGYDPRQGCRRLERVIQREVLEPLVERLYRKDWQDVSAIQVSVADGQIIFERQDKD